MLGKVEAHLAKQPEDGQGWEVIAPIYARLGRNDDAVRAFDNARRILGATSDREALYGEAVTRAHGGLVTADARAAFDRALAQDKGNVRARFYMAMALGQSGQTQPAIAAWRSLIDGAPSDATWLPIAQTELATLEGRPSPAMQANAPGPTAAQVAATAGQTPAERQQMIEGMVSGLAAKLDATPDDTEGWARLFRAYMVMGRPADAEAAYGRAKTALAAKPDLLAAIEKAARDNGIVKD
jgi:cytochrome c-type biogenesis protein CcmH